MKTPMKKYFQLGIVHFMAYPFAMSGEGEIEASVRNVLQDPYFDFIELTHINDGAVRKKVVDLAAQSCVGIGYGIQPQLLRNQENLNDLDESIRQRGMARVKQCIDEAFEMGAKGVAFLSGKYDPEKLEEHYQQLVKSTREICEYVAQKGSMNVLLEVFDNDVEKCALIGSAQLARRFAREISAEFPFFGLMADLSHIIQLGETLDQNLSPIAPYLQHVHIANAVLKQGAPAYGDQHPRFGFAHSEVGVAEIQAFLAKLFEIGYLGEGKRPVVSFEVKPWGDEDPQMVVEGAKRMLDIAWALMEGNE